jgi:hypothetical protein
MPGGRDPYLSDLDLIKFCEQALERAQELQCVTVHEAVTIAAAVKRERVPRAAEILWMCCLQCAGPLVPMSSGQLAISRQPAHSDMLDSPSPIEATQSSRSKKKETITSTTDSKRDYSSSGRQAGTTSHFLQGQDSETATCLQGRNPPFLLENNCVVKGQMRGLVSAFKNFHSVWGT